MLQILMGKHWQASLNTTFEQNPIPCRLEIGLQECIHILYML